MGTVSSEDLERPFWSSASLKQHELAIKVRNVQTGRGLLPVQGRDVPVGPTRLPSCFGVILIYRSHAAQPASKPGRGLLLQPGPAAPAGWDAGAQTPRQAPRRVNK